MTPEFFRDYALGPAYTLLPKTMKSVAATAQIIAICLQESRLRLRRQMYGGPARSYAQFEVGGGVRGVLQHALTKPLIRNVLVALDYSDAADSVSCYQAMEHNDVLCAAFSRLLLYTLPDVLPKPESPEDGWQQYLRAWRPGKPHRETWDQFYNQAWAVALKGI